MTDSLPQESSILQFFPPAHRISESRGTGRNHSVRQSSPEPFFLHVYKARCPQKQAGGVSPEQLSPTFWHFVFVPHEGANREKKAWNSSPATVFKAVSRPACWHQLHDVRRKKVFSPHEKRFFSAGKSFLMLNKCKNMKLKCEILYSKSPSERYRSLRATPFKWHQYFHFVNGKPPRDNRWKEMI